ncbi:MAG: HlyD family efflux transporter periplasmic adaptor subunit, partial [Candidatus Eremiobacteraeota bacterium]|nr:HlyD family efflux transporter periplasmic adaptor subunit [Candidatus Eremiobacteraeota bacterium]
MKRRRNTLILVAGVALVVVIGFFAARPGKSAIEVRQTVVRYGSFTTKLPETGVVQLPRTITLPAGVAGNLGRIAVRAGDRVVRGQLLATILNEQVASGVGDAADTAASARGKAQSVAESNAVLPQQNTSAIVQAQAAVVAARSQLTQAEQDVVAGSQSGLGYGGTTAEEQRLTAESTLSRAATDLREAKRTYEANQYLYDQKGLSRDALQQSEARFEQARVTYAQAKSERQILGGTLTRETQVLRDRVRSAQAGLRQADAALAAAQANASQSKAGDLESARADAQRAEADLAYARDQASRLEIRAPIDGIVESVAAQTNDSLRPVQPGDSVQLGEAIFTMAADDNYVVRTKVDEQDVAGIQSGQHAVVSGEDFGGATLAGHVVSISPIAQKSDDPSNTSRQVVTTIQLDKRLRFLRDGMTVDVDIVTRNEPHVLTIPTDALRKDDAGSYVYVVANGHARRANVHVG